MSTNQNILDAAAYELGYIDYGASLDATDSATALSTYNDMMHEWGEGSKDFNWFTQDTLADDSPIPKWAESGIKSNLAVRLGAVFVVSVTAETAKKARDGEKVINRTLINLRLTGADMSHLPGGMNSHRIETDT